MNRILNPFDYLSIGKTWGWGIIGTLVAIVLDSIVEIPLEGSCVKKVIEILSTNILLWLPLSGLLYLAALIFSPSRIRAVDIFATNLFALLPTIVAIAVLNLVSLWLINIEADPRSVTEILVRAAYNLVVIILSVTMVWSMVWGCFAYYVSANLKDWRGVVIFVSCYVFVSVVIQLLVHYL